MCWWVVPKQQRELSEVLARAELGQLGVVGSEHAHAAVEDDEEPARRRVPFSKTRAPAGQTRLTESPTISSSVGSSQAPKVGTPLSALTSVCVCVARVRGSGAAPSSIMLGA